MKNPNPNRKFQRELARERRLSMNEAGQFIADRAQKVAELADCHWGGQDKRGVLFFDTFATGPNEIAAPTVFFPFETVMDEPSKVTAWSREQHARYERKEQ
jgi:hypothetical protein